MTASLAEPTPEQFAEIYSSDLGLAGEFKFISVPIISFIDILPDDTICRTAIAHSIRE